MTASSSCSGTVDNVWSRDDIRVHTFGFAQGRESSRPRSGRHPYRGTPSRGVPGGCQHLGGAAQVGERIHTVGQPVQDFPVVQLPQAGFGQFRPGSWRDHSRAGRGPRSEYGEMVVFDVLFCDYLRPALWLDMLTCGSAWWTVSTNQHIGLRRVALCVCSDFAGARFVCHVPPA